MAGAEVVVLRGYDRHQREHGNAGCDHAAKLGAAERPAFAAGKVEGEGQDDGGGRVREDAQPVGHHRGQHGQMLQQLPGQQESGQAIGVRHQLLRAQTQPLQDQAGAGRRTGSPGCARSR